MLSERFIILHVCTQKGWMNVTGIQQSDVHLELLYRLRASAVTSE